MRGSHDDSTRVLNLLFRCPHKRLTRPVTPVNKDGKPLPSSADSDVLPPGMPGPRKSKIKLALGIAVPLGIVMIG